MVLRGLDLSTRANLALYDPAQSNGGMTGLYIADRAAMLSWVMDRAKGNFTADQASRSTVGVNNYVFSDAASNQKFSVVSNNPSAVLNPVRITFGGDGADALIGGDAAAGDHLYGGAGTDYLDGRGMDAGLGSQNDVALR